MRKTLIAAILLLSLSLTLPAQASSLTEAQIQALEGLLSSFNVPQATITTVDRILRGLPATATGGTTGGGGYTFTKPLTVGSTGTDVSELQKLLKAQGYFTYPSITTYYGPATAAAVAAFQKDHHIDALGGVGPLTRAVLNELESEEGSTVTTTTTQTAPTGTATSTTPSIGTTGGGGGGGGSAPTPSIIQNYVPPAAPSGGGGGSSGGGSSSSSGSGTPADTTPPSITVTAPTVNLAANTTQTILSATTNEAASCRYSTSQSFAYAQGTLFTATGNTTHTTTITGLTNGSSNTYYVKCSDTAGNVSGNASVTFTVAAPAPPTTTGTACPKGSTYQDGCANAPTGTAQLPTLLNGYTTRAPWNVAGVDYAVGVPAGTVLKDPYPNGVLAPALVALGGSANASNHVITFSGTSANNAVINGWDFSLEGGWTVLVSGATNVTLTNSNFKIGSNLRTPIMVSASTNGVTITGNVIDGAGFANSAAGGLIQTDAQGVTTVEYNLIENAYYQHIQVGPSSSGPTTKSLFQFNVFHNAGLGGPQGAHGDVIQAFSSSPGTPTFTDIETNFNTIVQDLPTAQASTQGVTYTTGGNTAVYLNESYSNNTTIVKAGSNTNYAFIMDKTELNGTAYANNNYVDPSGLGGTWINVENGPSNSTFNGAVNQSGNINMFTGQLFAGQVSTPLSDATPPSTPTNLGASAVSTSQINLAWTASTDNVGVTGYKIYRNGTQVGTSIVNSFSDTGLMASTAYIYTVSAYDAAGNGSAQSASVSATTQTVVSSSSCPKGTSYQDGCSAASAGTPQYPTLLSSYATRPPWNVAGVDYAVGITPGTVLKDPYPNGALAPALVALGGYATVPGNYIIFQNVNSAVIDGWDFSLEGGWTVVIQGDNATVKNSKFVVGSALRPPLTTNDYRTVLNLTVTNNEFDGSGLATNPAGGLLVLAAQGTTTIQYNLIKNAYYQLIQAGPGPVGTFTTQIIRYNVFQNAGQGARNGAHGDWVQDFGSSGYMFNDLEINYNTIIQNDPSAGTQGLSISGSATLAGFYNETVTNNTMVVKTNVNYPIIINTTLLQNLGTVNNNYLDVAGVVGSWLFAGNYGITGPYNGTVTTSGNTNMVTGQLFTGQTGASAPSADTTPPTVTITAPTGQLAAGTTQTALSVTTNENATCAYATAAGTAFASMTQFTTTGALSHTTTLGGLSNGSAYTYYVKCKDTAGNISADSSTSFSVASPAAVTPPPTTGGTTKTIFLTSGTTWTVPSDWNNANNTVEVIGGGSGGAGSYNFEGGLGGGGGGYSKSSNVALTPGTTVTIKVGAGGAGGTATSNNVSGAGGDTYLCSSTSNCASLAGSAVVVGAQGGQAATFVSTVGAGGAASSGVGSVKYSGGSGGAAGACPAYSGGGGAAGPNGNGAAGGACVGHGAGGGGGSGGGTAGSNGTANGSGGNGGNNSSGSGGGAGGAAGANGTNGGGGGGSGSAFNANQPGNGGAGIEWDAIHGSGGGGGGMGNAGGGTGTSGGAGGLYGGGGGGGGTAVSTDWPGGNGAQGLIVITYTP